MIKNAYDKEYFVRCKNYITRVLILYATLIHYRNALNNSALFNMMCK